MASKNDSTISIGWKIEDAEGGLKKVTMSAEDLPRIMKLNVEESEKLGNKFINLAAMCTLIDSLSSNLNSLKSVDDDLAGAYDVQIEAETRPNKRE